MTKRILIIPAAVIMILSFSACGRYPENQKQKTEWNSSQSIKQEESQNTKADSYVSTNTEKANSTKESESTKVYNSGTGSTAAIDDLIKTIKDVGGSVDSLDDVSDEDLNVRDPQ